jgi:hypothetical protein
MEYKIFGARQKAPGDFKDDLRAVLRLDDQQRDALADWFLSARSYELSRPSLPAAVAASTLLPDQFRQTARVIRFLLRNWQKYGLELQDIERDLLLLGFDSGDISVLSPLLARLSPAKERVWLDDVEYSERFVGLPAIADVNIVWNARPLFGGSSWHYYPADGDNHTTFLGLTYLATVEIFTSDRGVRQRTAIQLDEDDFQRLLRGMERAGEQLDILKERTKVVAPHGKKD